MQPTSESSSHSSTPITTAQADPQPAAPRGGPSIEGVPRVVSVMCPAGFTAYAAEGYDLSKPLFARVTYRAG